MQIQPNSTIKMCKGVPLDSSYKDTIYFSDKNSQYNYFNGKVKSGMVMSGASYQRVKGQEGVVRFGTKADNLYDCNYMMFQNTNYGNKWFYAFVTNVEYVNDNTSYVYFTVDVMQTWFLFECTLKESFVEREHHSTDNISDQLIPENIEVGEYNNTQFKGTNLFDSWSILILSPYDETCNKTFGNQPINGVATGCNALVITDSNYGKFHKEGGLSGENKWEGLTAWLLGLADEGSDSILSISMIPTSLLPTNFDLTNSVKITSSTSTTIKPFSVRKPSSLGKYIPKNNKLFTYPYTFLGISNNDGELADYRYEFFPRDTSNPFCTFEIGVDMVNGYYTMIPLNYSGTDNATGDTNMNLNNTLIMSGTPQCAYTLDSFKIWWAQNKVSMMTNIATDLLGGYHESSSHTEYSTFNKSFSGKNFSGGTGSMSSVSGSSPTGTMMALNIGKEVLSSIGEINKASKQPNYTKGGGGNSIMLGLGFQDFMYSQFYVQPEIAKSIDDYFTMFGYATKEVKVPNINVRPHWTYTQTIGCKVISDSCSNDDVTLIKTIFDNGITFWKNGNEIGNYSLNNSPT